MKDMYERAGKQTRLTEVNEIFLRGIAGLLGLKTRFTRDTAYPSSGRRPNGYSVSPKPQAPTIT